VQALVYARLSAFVRLGRPVFLVGGFALYALGAAIAASRGSAIDWISFAWGQLAVTSVQLMTHYSNDYFDLDADRANTTPTRWSGGSRVLPNDELPAWVALVAALTLAAIAVVAIVVIRTRVSAGPCAWLLLAMLVLAWEYSAPPLRLHSRGVGELDTALVVTLLVPLAGFSLQTGRLELLPVAAAVPLCFLQFAMLLAVEFPDEAGDAAVGKRTLVVRLGSYRASRLYAGALALAYVAAVAAVPAGVPWSACFAFVTGLPVAAWLTWQTLRGEKPRQWSRIAFGTAALLIGSALLELAAFARVAVMLGAAPGGLAR